MSEGLIDVALAPIRLVSDPAERIWWPALLLAWTMGVIWSWATQRKWSWKHFGRVLTHPSSRVDGAFLFVRAAVKTLVLAGIPAAAIKLAVWVVQGLWASLGAPPTPPGPVLLVATYSIVLFVVSDASRYGLHRLFHASNVLWRFHQVHHSAEVLTPLTLYRIHPVEQVLQALRGCLVVGSIGGVFAWWSHGQADPWTLFGVPAAILALNALGANLRHSHVPFRYPEAVERWLISPAQHQMHHAAASAGEHVNLGSFLGVWDWLGGSLRSSSAGVPRTFGLMPGDQNHDSRRVTSALLGPLRWD